MTVSTPLHEICFPHLTICGYDIDQCPHFVKVECVMKAERRSETLQRVALRTCEEAQRHTYISL